MQNVKATEIVNVATATAAKPVKAPRKPRAAAAKPVTVKPAAAPADKPAQAVNVHIGAVSTKKYDGPSGYLNANRKTAISNGYHGKAVASLTARTLGAFTAMRDCYGAKPFPARGFDNAILSMLAGCTTSGKATPFIKLTGGAMLPDASGTDKLCDVPGKPVIATVTAHGAAYGKA
jgi:hypothetical protein